MNEENMKILLGVVLSVLSETQLKEVDSKLDKLEKEIKVDLEKFKDEKPTSKPSYLG